jgi:transketolase
VFWDNNSISIDGSTALSVSDDQEMRFRAHGWHVQAVDGHDPHAVSRAIAAAKAVTDKPSMIACRTTIGLGAPSKAGTAGAHGAALGAKEIEGARIKLNWPYDAFEVPDEIRAAWKQVAAKGAEPHAAWKQRHAAAQPDLRDRFDRQIAGELTPGWEEAIGALIAKFASEKPKIATRQASQQVLNALAPALPELLGGSADLTPSNLTQAKAQTVATPQDFAGS